MSENYEKTTPAEETTEQEVTEVVVSAEEIVEETATEEQTVAEIDDIAEEESVDPEKDMTMGAKLKVLLMNPLATSIIKWVFIFFGIVGLVLYFIATSSRTIGESFAKAFSGISGAIASLFSLIPISMFEILICAAILGILAYLVFIIIKTVKTKGKFHIAGLWVQFGYSLLAVAGVFTLLSSICYGIYTYRNKLSTVTSYNNAKATNVELSETMLYLIDNINNTLSEGGNNIFFRASGLSQYATIGRSTEEITKKVSEAFEAAAQDIPTLKGKSLSSKELLFTPLYSHFQISSIYSPFTGELCINTEYPEIIIPMQVAKTMAMQRGYTDDGDADFIAFLVCTQYSDDYYIQYSGYFNAYMQFNSTVYDENGKNLHLYMANSLRDKVKKEYVQVVNELDELYGVKSELKYVAASSTLSANDYCDAAKLLLKNFRQGLDNGTISMDDTEEKNFGKYCNYLIDFYRQDTDFQYNVEDVYEEYHPSQD